MKRVLPILVLALAGCGHEAATAPKPVRAVQTLVTPMPTQPATTAADPRVAAGLQLLQKGLAVPMVEYSHTLHYVKADGTKPWLKSRYRYQKGSRNHLRLLSGSDSKVADTQIAWKDGESKAQVHTKFIGFWITTGLEFSDERMNDPLGNKFTETTMQHFYATLTNPGNQWSFVADGVQGGKPMTVLGLVSPGSMKGITREVIGLDKATGLPVLRDLYAGTRQALHETADTARVATFKSSDLDIQ
ncbi:MAG: hypothetical protein JWM80_3391 [Cyanobacteria bacterium RYN_339]|nr:hypothetical protein [Cyanobacteria bacterium RYN_339]